MINLLLGRDQWVCAHFISSVKGEVHNMQSLANTSLLAPAK
jgi:hypothetical protein